jgi:hypothetical protein
MMARFYSMGTMAHDGSRFPAISFRLRSFGKIFAELARKGGRLHEPFRRERQSSRSGLIRASSGANGRLV